jgi:hypothetical protein
VKGTPLRLMPARIFSGCSLKKAAKSFPLCIAVTMELLLLHMVTTSAYMHSTVFAL